MKRRFWTIQLTALILFGFSVCSLAQTGDGTGSGSHPGDACHQQQIDPNAPYDEYGNERSKQGSGEDYFAELCEQQNQTLETDWETVAIIGTVAVVIAAALMIVPFP